MLGENRLFAVGERRIAQKIYFADDGGIDVDQGFHRRHEKRAGAAGRINQRKLLQCG